VRIDDRSYAEAESVLDIPPLATVDVAGFILAMAMLHPFTLEPCRSPRFLSSLIGTLLPLAVCSAPAVAASASECIPIELGSRGGLAASVSSYETTGPGSILCVAIFPG